MRHEACDVSILETRYPARLRDLIDPPHILSVLGPIDFESRPVLAVIGSRHSSLQAEIWMRRHLRELTKSCLIVSGGARGIDEVAHAIAIEAGQPTLVVLPSGLNCPYPRDWAEKSEDVLNCGGAIISEYSSNTEVRAWHFEKRNRLIAALADVVLVIEARHRSGTAITVRHALGLGRPIAALPWFPDDARGEYCNEIIANGGFVARNASDIVDLLIAEARMRVSNMRQISAVPNSPQEKDACY